MKGRVGISIVSLLLCAICIESSSTGVTPDNPAVSSRVVLEHDSEYVKGFPLILGLTVRGPQWVPRLSLGLLLGEVELTFEGERDESIYILRMKAPYSITLADSSGRMIEAPKHHFDVHVASGEVRKVLVDISRISRISAIGHTKLCDIPPGTYSLHVKSPSSGWVTTKTRIRVRDPNLEEERFLREVRKDIGVEDDGGIYGGIWSGILGVNPQLLIEGLEQLQGPTRRVVAFYIILTRAAQAKGMSKRDSKLLENLNVPSFLETEKAWLLAEMAFLSGEEKALDKLRRIAADHPSLRWRLESLHKRSRSSFDF